ncbi:MAG: c-type cytochrome [Gemmatimonadota bacterium]
MRRLLVSLILPAAFLIPLAAAEYDGGWYVATVHELPDYLVVGEPFELTFTLRAHGVTPMVDRTPSVRLGATGPGVAARPNIRPGVYTATLEPAEAGTVSLAISAGAPFTAGVRLLPMEVLAAPNGNGHALPMEERGRRLFVAKGCASCHMHARAEQSFSARVGPELTDRAYNRGILRRVLQDPESILESAGWPMPTLELTDAEIDALSAFING